MISVEDMGGDSCYYTYDGQDIITNLQNTQGTWIFRHQFPAEGYNNTIDPLRYFDYITKVTDPGGRTNYYQLTGHETYGGFVHTDPNGHQTWYYSHDAINSEPVITAVKDADGNEARLAYDHSTGQIASMQSPGGKTVSYTYSTLGNPTSVTTPLGTSQTTYAASGLDVTLIKNMRGNTVMQATYNSWHEPLSVTTYPTTSTNLSYTTTYTYTSWGAPETVTNPKNEVTTYNYDSSSKRVVSVTHSGPSSAAVTIASYAYDPIGRVVAATDAAGLTQQFVYNDLDKPIEMMFPDGTRQSTDYVCCRLPGVTTDRQGRKTYYDYDEAKRLRRVQDAEGNTLQYGYDNAGNLTSLLDSRGSYTRWDYDADDQLVRKTYTDGTHNSFAYNADGQLVQATDTRGSVTKYEYDSAGQLIKVDYPNDADVTYTYDDLGRRTSMTDAVGTTQWGFDLLGRSLSENGPWANDTVSYSYDELSRPVSQSVGGTYTTSVAYDDLGRLTDVSSPASVGTSTSGWHWDYNPSQVGYTSRPTQLTLPSGAQTRYGWQDQLQRLSSVQNLKSDGTTVLSQFTYSFGTNNGTMVRTGLTRQMRGTDNVLRAAQTISYGYDSTYQLTNEQSGETTPEVKNAYVYDAMGNRTSWRIQGAGIGGSTAQNERITTTTNRLNQVTGASVVDTDNTPSTILYAYDVRGNQTRAENTSGENYTSYVYNDSDHLVKVLVRKRANQPVPNQPVEQTLFAYDGFGRRRETVEQTFNTTTNQFVTQSDVRLVYDGMDVVQERDANTNVVRAAYTRIGNIGGILARQSYTSAGALDTTGYYHYDGSGNVVQVSDASQSVRCAYWYSSFGGSDSVQQSIGYEQPYRFSSKALLTGIGLYDYGTRFYNPGTGRWLNRDSLQESGGTNMYAFAGNNPVNDVDTYGEEPTTLPPVIPGYDIAEDVASIVLKAAGSGSRLAVGAGLGVWAYLLLNPKNSAEPGIDDLPRSRRPGGFNVALGLAYPEELAVALAAFALKHDALFWPDFPNLFDKPSSGSWSPGRLVLSAMAFSKRIYFRCDEFDADRAMRDGSKGAIKGNLTNWEYWMIKTVPGLEMKTRFYRGGKWLKGKDCGCS